MSKIKFEFIASAKLRMEADTNVGRSRVISIDTLIDSEEKFLKGWLNSDGIPNEMGMKAQVQGFIQGLVSSIHVSEKMGYRDSTEHLRYIVSEIEREFAKSNVEIVKGDW